MESKFTHDSSSTLIQSTVSLSFIAFLLFINNVQREYVYTHDSFSHCFDSFDTSLEILRVTTVAMAPVAFPMQASQRAVSPRVSRITANIVIN